ncbi:hypothetical protein HF285_12925 [Acidithiobacillus ferrooxidans F221]|uniref:GyrI-like domain-containing protein n=1 Tax=Acidithiobacillus ferrooxidans TaxID=920 RepID=UPI001C07655E|nr:GyrI-like domain-containing protein [Acidithiobacillus ferrooxidans]MBU2809131.1 hypothetical protein [Acidithiobacillus ferrooxidans F221]
MQIVDLKKELRQLYQPSAKEVCEVQVPPMIFLMIDGEGDPNTAQGYAEAVEALFSVSYTIKFMVKKGTLATDYGVMPLEGLWWADDMSSFSANDKSKWKWTMMIMQPAFVTKEIIGNAIAEVKRKKDPPALAKLRIEKFVEGRCAQILHIGPFSEEGPTIERVHQYIDARGKLTGKHHEIYLSDIRKADPTKWKTIIRQPMK